MWEPAFGAGFQARWDGQQSSAKIPLKVPPSVISTANSEFCPFWCECCRWRLHKTKMCVSRNPRRTNILTDCRVVQSRILRNTNTREAVAGNEQMTDGPNHPSGRI